MTERVSSKLFNPINKERQREMVSRLRYCVVFGCYPHGPNEVPGQEPKVPNMGYELAVDYLEAGAEEVVLADYHNGIIEVADALNRSGRFSGKARGEVVDVRRTDHVRDVLGSMKQVNIIAYLAAKFDLARIARLSTEELLDEIDIDLRGAIRVSHIGGQFMRENEIATRNRNRDGKEQIGVEMLASSAASPVVEMSLVAGAYGINKAGIDALTKLLIAEHQRDGVPITVTTGRFYFVRSTSSVATEPKEEDVTMKDIMGIFPEKQMSAGEAADIWFTAAAKGKNGIIPIPGEVVVPLTILYTLFPRILGNIIADKGIYSILEKKRKNKQR